MSDNENDLVNAFAEVYAKQVTREVMATKERTLPSGPYKKQVQVKRDNVRKVNKTKPDAQKVPTTRKQKNKDK